MVSQEILSLGNDRISLEIQSLHGRLNLLLFGCLVDLGSAKTAGITKLAYSRIVKNFFGFVIICSGSFPDLAMFSLFTFSPLTIEVPGSYSYILLIKPLHLCHPCVATSYSRL